MDHWLFDYHIQNFRLIPALEISCFMHRYLIGTPFQMSQLTAGNAYNIFRPQSHCLKFIVYLGLHDRLFEATFLVTSSYLPDRRN